MSLFADETERLRREAVCKACPHRKEIPRLRLHVCERCGCPLYAKVRAAASTCPESRW